jgi:hypothetical protein
VAAIASAWRPGHAYELTYADASSRIVTRDADTGAVIWTVAPRTRISEIAWAADGALLLALGPDGARLYNPRGRLVHSIASARGAPILDGAISADARSVALIRGGVGGDVVLASLSAGSVPKLRPVLPGNGLRQLEFSPDGRWLLVSWPLADQWVFVRVAGKPRIAAVSRIKRQFMIRSAARGFPEIEGWCCTAGGSAG